LFAWQKQKKKWIPAFAGMTRKKKLKTKFVTFVFVRNIRDIRFYSYHSFFAVFAFTDY